MKKWMISLIIVVLAGMYPLSTYAVKGNPDIQSANYLAGLISLKQEHDNEKSRDDEDEKRKQWERQEQERKNQERNEQERRDHERRDQEHRERDHRDGDHQDHDQNDREHRDDRDRDHKDHDRWEREHKERERREWERRKEEERREEERRERERREKIRLEWERWEHEHRDRRYNGYWRLRNIMQEREDCRYIIHRTAQVILFAQRLAARRHYTWGLSRAVAHQRLARELYAAGFYWSAIHHSLRARNLAILVIKGNRNLSFWKLYVGDPREDRYCHNAPKDHELDIRIDLNTLLSDDALLNIQLDLDLKD